MTPEWIHLYAKEIKDTLREFVAAHGFPPCPKVLVERTFYKTPGGGSELNPSETSSNSRGKRAPIANTFLSRQTKKCRAVASSSAGTPEVTGRHEQLGEGTVASSSVGALEVTRRREQLGEDTAEEMGENHRPQRIEASGRADTKSKRRGDIVDWARQLHQHNEEQVSGDTKQGYFCRDCGAGQNIKSRLLKTLCLGYKIGQSEDRKARCQDRKQMARMVGFLRASGDHEAAIVYVESHLPFDVVP